MRIRDRWAWGKGTVYPWECDNANLESIWPASLSTAQLMEGFVARAVMRATAQCRHMNLQIMKVVDTWI